MFIEDLFEKYPEELEALNVSDDMPYTFSEVQEIADRCEAYRERKSLSKVISELEKKVESLDSRLKVLEQKDNN